MPKPPFISGSLVIPVYCLNPGLLIRLSSLITGAPSKYLNLISISGFGTVLTTSQKVNTFESIFFGFPLIALIITLSHFFFYLNCEA